MYDGQNIYKEIFFINERWGKYFDQQIEIHDIPIAYILAHIQITQIIK